MSAEAFLLIQLKHVGDRHELRMFLYAQVGDDITLDFDLFIIQQIYN